MSKKTNILCTICARGGSKGVKDKNIRLLAGKPLITYTIKQAIKWGKASHIVVSTDSENIADVSKKSGAEVFFKRPKALASDKAAKLPVIRHALKESEKFFNERFHLTVDLDPTSPIRKIEDIDNCLRIFMHKKPKTLFSVVKAKKSPYFNMVEEKKDGFISLCKKKGAIISRQSSPRVYSMNASIYLYVRNFLLDDKNITPFSNRSIVYIMDDLSAHDIDNEVDFRFIEFLIKEGVWKNEI